MHITVVCPQCRSRYQVDDALRGKKMRCPNGKCRATFDVVEEGKPPPAPPPAPKPAPKPAAPPPSPRGQTGSVGEVVPILPVEPAAPPPRPQGNHVSNYVPVEQAEVASSAPNAPTGASFGDWRNLSPSRGGTATPPPPPASRPATVPPTRKDPPPKASAPPAKPASQPPKPQAQPATPPPKPQAQPAVDGVPGTPAVADWHAAPPPVIQPGDSRPAPVEMPPGAWQNVEHLAPTGQHGPSEEEEAHRLAKKRRARRLMIGMIAGMLLVMGIGAVVFYIVVWQNEGHQFDRAMNQYNEGHFVDAGKAFRKLADKFSSSSRADEYRLWAALSELRGSASGDIDDALEQLDKFLTEALKTERGQELMNERAEDIGKALAKATAEFIDAHKSDNDSELEKSLTGINQGVDRVRGVVPKAITADEADGIKKEVRNIQENIDLEKRRQKALVKLREIAKNPSIEAIKAAKAFIRETVLSKAVPTFENDADAAGILASMHEAHIKTILFELPKEGDPGVGRRSREDIEPSILIDPLLAGRPRPAGQPRPVDDEGSVVLALARGVLYALYPSDGQIKWAMRVGIDTAHLPIRLPAEPAVPNERLLVLSADARTLTALDMDGRRLWEYHLGSPCLGRPLVVNRRAYLPTLDEQGGGEVHEIELFSGRPMGKWKIGQGLSVGGVHQRGTNLVYFPAVDSCVYVLDVVSKACAMVLYTNHPAGSLRGEPLILGDDATGVGGAGPAYLALPQADGLDETVLKLYELPVRDRHAPAVSMTPPPRIQGWTWFTPYADSEKVVCISDAARLGLFGIKQARNDDPPLFPLVRNEDSAYAGLDLSDQLGKGVDQRRGRSLVAGVQGDDLWVLTRGRLQRFELRLNRKTGPQVVHRWKNPLDLGSPLHAEQSRETQAGTTLYLVTQPLGRPVVLATAVDPEADENAAAGDPRLRWQRQLGMVCHGTPIVLGGEVVAMDRAGGLFRFDRKQVLATLQKDPATRWLEGAENMAAGMDGAEAEPPQLLQVNARTVLAIASPGGTRLVIRQYTAGAARADAEVEIDLQGAKLAGNVIAHSDFLVVPLNNGSLVRYSLPLAARPMADPGPSWRTDRDAGPSARCHIVPLGPDEFLTTGGGRGLTRWNWPAGKPFAAVLPPQRVKPPTGEANQRIVSPPLVGTIPGPNQAMQVMVADAAGTLSLLVGDGLVTQRTWDLGGRITAGPFLRAGFVGCVVEEKQLVWIDPSRDGILWAYRTDGAAIVGEPQLVDDMVVVADKGGQFFGIHPWSGIAWGQGYRLRAVVAPATAPVAFSPGRAFAPLTDGTMMLLATDRLRDPWWERLMRLAE